MYADPDGHSPIVAYKIAKWSAENPGRVLNMASGVIRGLVNTARGLFETGKQAVKNEVERNFNPHSYRSTLLDRDESSTYRPGTTERQQMIEQMGEGFVSSLKSPFDAYKAFKEGRDEDAGEKLFEAAITYGSLYGPVKGMPRGIPRIRGKLPKANNTATISTEPASEVRNVGVGETQQLALPAPPKPVGLLEAPKQNGVDFYVSPSGEALHAKGYRYSDSRFAESIVENHRSPGTPGGHYFGPNGYATTEEVASAYQISPEWSDVKVEGAFDTLQLYDSELGRWKAEVPKSHGNSTNVPEPYTSAYPEYGEGGVQQYITEPDTPLNYDNVRILDQ